MSPKFTKSDTHRACWPEARPLSPLATKLSKSLSACYAQVPVCEQEMAECHWMMGQWGRKVLLKRHGSNKIWRARWNEEVGSKHRKYSHGCDHG
jgi:hypothetical protein